MRARRSVRLLSSEPAAALAVFLGLLGATLIALWPWPLDMWSVTTVGDGGVATWDYWWVAESTLHMQNPWWTGFIFAPVGTFLMGHGLLLVPALLAAPLTLTIGAPLAVNLTFPVWVAVAGTGSYLLCRLLPFDRIPALVAAGSYALAPAMLFRVPEHLGLVAGLALFPFALAIAVRFLRSPGLFWASALGAAVAVLVYTDVLAAAYTVPTVAACVAVGILRRSSWRRWRTWAELAVAIVVATLLLAPQFVASAKIAMRGEDYSIPDSTLAASLVTYPTDPVDILLPSPASRYLTAAAHSARDGWNDSGWAADGVVTPGVLLLVLAATGVGLSWRRTRTKFLVAWTLAAWLLAMGPVIRFAGQTHIPFPIGVDGVTVSAIMPATWFAHVPVLGDLRVPQRFAMLALLPLAILAACAVQSATRRVTHRVALVLGFLLICGFMLEGARTVDANLPLENGPITAPIAADPSASVVTDVPISWQSGISAVGAVGAAGPAMTRATQHGHPISSGYISRVNQSRVQELSGQPFYSYLLERQVSARTDPLPASEVRYARRNALAMNARWAVVWPEAGPAAMSYLRQVGFRLVARSQGCALLHLGPVPSQSIAALKGAEQ